LPGEAPKKSWLEDQLLLMHVSFTHPLPYCMLHDDITAFVLERTKCIQKHIFLLLSHFLRTLISIQATHVLVNTNGALHGPTLSCCCKVIRPQTHPNIFQATSWIKCSLLLS